MGFRIRIETDNAAFGDTAAEAGAEVCRILRDINGNHVGSAEVTE